MSGEGYFFDEWKSKFQPQPEQPGDGGSSQPSLPQPEPPITGENLKDSGQDQALTAQELWRNEAELAAVALARSREAFTSEDIISLVGLPTGEPGTNRNNAVGALMTALCRQGMIQKTGRRVKARRVSSHAAELTEWIGAQVSSGTQ